MTILVTGGAGYIGSHTVIELLNAGNQVVIIDNFSNSHPEVMNRIREISQKDFTFYEIDILDKKSLKDVFTKHSIDSVIHFAAYKSVGESVKQPLKYYKNNVYGTMILLEVMEEFQVKRMVYSSSASVYGVNNPSPLDETMPLGKASNPYAYTKVVNEQLLKDISYADPEWSVSILRYFNPIGAHESGLIGEDPQGIPNNIMPYLTQVAVKRLDYLSIYGNDYPTVDGTGVRDYIHVVDLAKGHVFALDQVMREVGTSIYNLGTGRGYSVLELVDAFEKATSIKIDYQFAPRRPGDLAEVYANPSLAKEQLGWQTEKDLTDMCRDSWRWQSQNPNGFSTQ